MKDQFYAHNPGRLPFSPVQYIRCHPVLLVLPIVVIVVITGVCVARGVPLWIGAAVSPIFGIAALLSVMGTTKRKLQEGNLCAAQVVSVSPYTVAVLTDLCNDRSAPKLALKIYTSPLQNMAGGAPKLGAKLAAASLYAGPPDTGAWQNFGPTIANCACVDLIQIKRAVDSIDAADWPVIAQAMTLLKPSQIGLHHLQA